MEFILDNGNEVDVYGDVDFRSYGLGLYLDFHVGIHAALYLGPVTFGFDFWRFR